MMRRTLLLVGLASASLGGSLAAGRPSAFLAPPPVGQTHHITPKDLPGPNHSPDATNPPVVVPQPPGARLTLPDGFVIETFAEGGFKRPRWLAEGPNGDIFLADADLNTVFLLRDADRDGKAEERTAFAEGLNKPFGMAFARDYFYVANTNNILRFKYRPGHTKADGPPEKIADLPGRGYREHWTRNLLFSPDGSKLYATVGSESNVDPEPEPLRATVVRYNPDGTGREIVASGARNPIGLSFHPGTKQLWMAVQERDRLGDDLVPDYVTHVIEGGFYGWPYAYVGPIEDPRRKGERPDLVKKTLVPDVLIQAHSAILGLAFYDGPMFPASYRGGAFAALHGSWNRAKRTGYKIVYLPFKDGKATGEYQDFITGWMLGEDQKEVWGRPVAVLPLRDGSLLITDDGANKIWRVTYRKK